MGRLCCVRHLRLPDRVYWGVDSRWWWWKCSLVTYMIMVNAMVNTMRLTKYKIQVQSCVFPFRHLEIGKAHDLPGRWWCLRWWKWNLGANLHHKLWSPSRSVLRVPVPPPWDRLQRLHLRWPNCSLVLNFHHQVWHFYFWCSMVWWWLLSATSAKQILMIIMIIITWV